MEISMKSCRLCLSETEFNVSLFGNYCRRNNLVDKILVCLRIVIEETDALNTICYKCAENVERYHNFIMSIKKSQTKMVETRNILEKSINRRHVTSYVREQVIDADYTFSFLEAPEEEKKPSSPMFSYFSPQTVIKKSGNEPIWKTPRPLSEDVRREARREDKYKRQIKTGRPRHHSRDLFESQSQDVEENDHKSLDWKLTPDDNIIKRVMHKCFGRSEF